MSKMNVEIYDAMIEAGATEPAARKVAISIVQDSEAMLKTIEDNFDTMSYWIKERFDRNDNGIKALENRQDNILAEVSKGRVNRWMMGTLITLNLLLAAGFIEFLISFHT